MIVFISLLLFLLFLVCLLLISIPECDFEGIAPFAFPVLLILDFSLRFLLKKNTSAAILPYLCLPVQRRILILYMILSDMQRVWIWGCWLLYGITLYMCGTLTLINAPTLLFMLLFNNSLIAFVKTLVKGYAVLTYPVCLIPVCMLLFIISVLVPLWSVFISFVAVCSVTWMLYHVLKEDLYDDLNRTAL
jgi:hypothetical protein